MKKKLISIMACPKCSSSLILQAVSKTKTRIHTGKLLCKKCNNEFEIIDDIVCFKSITQKDRNRVESRRMINTFLKQEFKKDWIKRFLKKEFNFVKDEWKWMINNLNLRKSKIHLDWATGTGRFLRNILSIIRGEIIALETDYATCVWLKLFLKKLKKYSRATIICGDARNMPFRSNSIGSISSWHGLDEPKMDKVIDESKRVLKKGKRLALSGVFYEKNSKSLKLARKWEIRFAQESQIYKYFQKLDFKDIKYKIFFKAKWSDRKSFLPRFEDYYSSYAISAKKSK
jgi:ubiquinone/menaquinone biosynthesis C-methylase UbiE/uncharacterized protein YbaR (Trm112 family)